MYDLEPMLLPWQAGKVYFMESVCLGNFNDDSVMSFQVGFKFTLFSGPV